MTASRRTCPELMKLFINRKAEVNYQSLIDGNSSLHEVIQPNNPQSSE